MRKIILTVLGVVAVLSVMGQQYPQWLLDLINQNSSLIDSVTSYYQHPSAPAYQSYVIYYHQPLLIP